MKPKELFTRLIYRDGNIQYRKQGVITFDSKGNTEFENEPDIDIPIMSPVSGQTKGMNTNSTKVEFSITNYSIGDVSFTWVNDTTSIGLAASGTGNIASFTLKNNGTSVVEATVTVTPHVTYKGKTVDGEPVSFVYAVLPKITPNDISDQNFEEDEMTNTIVFSSNKTGSKGTVSYIWYNSNTTIGLAGQGTGNIPSFKARVGWAKVEYTARITYNGVTFNGNKKNFFYYITEKGLPDADIVYLVENELPTGGWDPEYTHGILVANGQIKEDSLRYRCSDGVETLDESANYYSIDEGESPTGLVDIKNMFPITYQIAQDFGLEDYAPAGPDQQPIYYGIGFIVNTSITPCTCEIFWTDDSSYEESLGEIYI